MKKLFGRDKAKARPVGVSSRDIGGQGGLGTQSEDTHYYQQQHSQDRSSIRVSSDDHWDIVSAHDGGSPHLHAYSPRAVSPFSIVPPAVPPKSTASIKSERDREPQLLKKKAPSVNNATAAVGILKALDPHPDILTPTFHQDHSDEHIAESIHREDKRERKGFWERASERSKDKEKDKEKKHHHREQERKDEDAQAELTRMIGYLTATSSEDWSLVLEVCERASANEANAKEAMKALRKEFKYAEPQAQLSAARLWAVMLRNCREVFTIQCSSRKFLETLEDVLQSSKTIPVVRERLMVVLAGAAHASPSGGRHEREGFRGLWRKVKLPDQPEDGIPFDTNDSMFTPPVPNFQEPPISGHGTNVARRPSAARHKSSRNRVIPPEEDMRRLFQECKVGTGNATLLSDALAFTKPEDLKTQDVIREFYARCRASQELIFAQIPWASAGAERSRLNAGRGSPQLQKRTKSNGDANHSPQVARANSKEGEVTQEEKLLAALLAANEQLTEVLRLYDDIEVARLEREAEERSKKETRIDRRQLYYDPDGQVHLEPPQPQFAGATSSHTPSPSSSPSPSPAPSFRVTNALPNPHPLPHPPPPLVITNSQHPSHISTPSLAPPPHAPHGPRLPHSAIPRSRTPSPDRSSMTHSTTQHSVNNYYDAQGHFERYHSEERERYLQDERYHHDIAQAMNKVGNMHLSDGESPEGSEDDPTVYRPSAKALGKRRIVADESESTFDPDDLFYEHANDSRRSDDLPDDDSDSATHRNPWHQPVHYVYDAAAERMQERLKEGRMSLPSPGVVH